MPKRVNRRDGAFPTPNMEEVTLSRFKAECHEVIERVHKTGMPVRVTRYGKPWVEVMPVPMPQSRSRKSWLGCMRDSGEILGDIVGPIRAFEDWKPIK